MSELQIIESTVQRAAHRRRWQRAWLGLWHGLLVGACLWLLTLGLYKLFPLPFSILAWAGLLAGLAMVGGFIIGGWRPTTLLQAARWVDQREKLQERLSTALEVAAAKDGEWRGLVVTDAARHAGHLNVRQMLPYRLPSAARWALLVLALGAGLGFVPEYRSKAFLQKKREAEIIRDTGKQLAELTRRSLERRPPALEPVRKNLDAVAELGDHFAKAKLTRTEALRDLANVTDKLKEQAKQLGQDPALKRLEQAARTPGAGSSSSAEAQKQIDALKQSLGNQAANNPDALDKLQKELDKARAMAANLSDKSGSAGDAAREQLNKTLSDLAQQAQDLGLQLPDLNEAITALAGSQFDQVLKDLQAAQIDLEKLQAMAQALKQLQQQAAQTGKDLPEQLHNGEAEAAAATLKKMAEQLKSANLSSQDLQKILDEVGRAIDPASPYGKAADYLKDAARQMRQGDKPGAADSLAKAAQELNDLMQQLADAQSLMAALAACQKAGMCIGTCQGWGQCKGPPRFGPGGKPGRGVGTWADETGWTYYNPNRDELVDNSGVQRPDLAPRGHSDRGEGEARDDLTPTKIRGQFSPGGPMPSITLKGVSIKGQSTVAYQEAVTTAQSDAESALSQEKVPRAYQGAVRDYFDDLKK
ncbi:MAG: hypothetical protein HYY24_22945 [Verrucomicrobia bacterium]|nr:hypothetical protein [Verrucomicrobiota bacterium]